MCVCLLCELNLLLDERQRALCKNMTNRCTEVWTDGGHFKISHPRPFGRQEIKKLMSIH